MRGTLGAGINVLKTENLKLGLTPDSPGAGGACDRVAHSVPVRGRARQFVLLGVILLIATALRLFHLGQSSLWFDEVVTMRLARTESPARALRLLPQIDATRAPLHPLLLQAWVAVFGPSDYSGRLFSCLCGISTVALVYWIGIRAFDATTALFASWLCRFPRS